MRADVRVTNIANSKIEVFHQESSPPSVPVDSNSKSLLRLSCQTSRYVFVADGIRGKSTVIAQAEHGQYAFYRGTQSLGPEDIPQPIVVLPQSGQKADKAVQRGKQSKLLKGLRSRNGLIQLQNQKRQNDLYFNDESGVRVEADK